MEMIAAGSTAAALVCAYGWWKCAKELSMAEIMIIHLAVEAGHIQKITIDKENLH